MTDQLPRILAGPIVRRVEPKGCSFWVATSVAAKVTVSIWLDDQMAGATPGSVASGDAPLASSPQTDLHQFGENLYAGVVTIPLGTGTAVLSPGRIYSYDLTFSGAFGATGLRQEKLLQDEQAGSRLPGVDASAPLHLALGYIENRLPSFATPPATITSDGNLHIAHTSCRKSNGSGPDALAWLDDELEQNYVDADKRVQQLFLTGDQIYADDLGACLLPMLNGLGRDMLGSREERIPVSDTFSAEGIMPNFPALRRARLVREKAKMTSIGCDNHLLTFAEYMAMYMVAWSPRAWQPLATNDNLFTPPPPDPGLKDTYTDWEGCYQSEQFPIDKWRQEKEGGVNAERQAVEAFRASVPKVARVLANIATYMITDDHEVTDDWNLNKRWRNRVYSNPLGRMIARNGLMAYGVCQGWGNDPDEFSKSDSQNKKFLDEVQKLVGTQPQAAGPIPVGSPDTVDQMLGLLDSQKTVKWHYTVPGPLHQVNVFDTRTRRKYSGEGIAPPDLVGDTLKDQLPAGPLTDGRELLFAVTPGPVLLPRIMEEIAASIFEMVADFRYGYAKAASNVADPCEPGGLETGVEAADAEGWGANPPARENFLKQLATYKQAVILSGDVHYAASLTMDYWTGSTPTPARIIQLVASSARNSFNPTVEALLSSDALLQRYEQGQNPELLGWTGQSTIKLPDGAKIGPGRRGRMRRSPALVPAGGWPAGTTIPAEADKQPNWRWWLKLMRDERPDSQLPIEGPHPPAYAGPELDPAQVSTFLPAYRAVASRHQTAALTGDFVSLRQMVFTTNIGLVDVSKTGNAYTIRHTLLSHSKDEPYKGVANTVHTIPLSPTSEAAPVLQTES